MSEVDFAIKKYGKVELIDLIKLFKITNIKIIENKKL